MTEAQQAAEKGEVPVGAVLEQKGHLLAKSHNRVEELSDPTAHAELLCISGACSYLRSRVLADAILWVSVEPCPMCAYAIELARIPKVIAFLPEPKTGFQSRYGLSFPFAMEWAPEPARQEMQHLLQGFFRQLRRP